MTRSLILLLCCASIASATSFAPDFESAALGPKGCATGPVNWCHNFTAAIECGAAKHCTQSVWLVHEPTVKAGLRGFCESVVLGLRAGIGHRDPHQRILDALKIVCSLTLATDEARTMCQDIVDELVAGHFGDLSYLLASDTHPSVVCHVLGLCSQLERRTAGVADDEDLCLNSLNASAVPASVSTSIEAGERDSKSLLGAKRCTWGPTYWCRSLTTAAECNATSRCIRDVWPTRTFDEDDDSVCRICEDTVAEARAALRSNESPVELKRVFESSCESIPVAAVRVECANTAAELSSELVELSLSKLTATAVCTVAQLCNSAAVDRALAAQTTVAVRRPPDVCVNCTAAVVAAERYLRTASPGDLRDKLLRLCGLLSSYSDACTQLVVAHFDGIRDSLIERVRPFAVCHLSGMCGRRYHEHPVDDDDKSRGAVQAVETLLAGADGGVSCDLCTQFLVHVKTVLTANTSEAEFRDMLRAFCQQLDALRGDCQRLVDDGYALAYRYLTEELNPREVCAEIQLCAKSVDDDERSNAISAPPATSVAPPTSAAECAACELIVRTAQREMAGPEFGDDVRRALNATCRLVPAADRVRCDEFVRRHAAELVRLLVDEAEPATVCALLRACAANTAARDHLGNELCPICEYVFHFIQEELQDPSEQQKIEDLVRRVCDMGPATSRAECEKFVGDYAALIISVASQELDPSLVCPALKVCPSAATSSAALCPLCVRLVGRVTGRDALGTLVARERGDPAATIVALQLSVVHGDELRDAIMADLDAAESCVLLRYCEAADVAGETQALDGADERQPEEETNEIAAPAPIAEPDKPSCELCELMVAQLHADAFAAAGDERRVKTAMLAFCDRLADAPFRRNCTRFARKYAPAIANVVGDRVPVADVCGYLKACPLRASSAGPGDAAAARCTLCEAVVDAYRRSAGRIAGHSSVDEVLRLCEAFGGAERARCMKVVAYTGDEVERTADAAIPGWYYCARVGMCPPGAHLAYREACADRSRWCADAKTAVLCDKLAHCRERVWKSMTTPKA